MGRPTNISYLIYSIVLKQWTSWSSIPTASGTCLHFHKSRTDERTYIAAGSLQSYDCFAIIIDIVMSLWIMLSISILWCHKEDTCVGQYLLIMTDERKLQCYIYCLISWVLRDQQDWRYNLKDVALVKHFGCRT